MRFASSIPKRPKSRSPYRRILIGLVVATVGASTACVGPTDPDGTFLSFLKGRERWSTRQVQASVEGSGGAGTELTLSLVAEHPETGELLTFLAPVPSLQGSHPMRVFGTLRDRSGEVVPVTNACPSGGKEIRSSGSLSIELHDAEARSLDGSFIANVCRVDDPDQTWTLADGKFRRLTY